MCSECFRLRTTCPGCSKRINACSEETHQVAKTEHPSFKGAAYYPRLLLQEAEIELPVEIYCI